MCRLIYCCALYRSLIIRYTPSQRIFRFNYISFHLSLCLSLSCALHTRGSMDFEMYMSIYVCSHLQTLVLVFILFRFVASQMDVPARHVWGVDVLWWVCLVYFWCASGWYFDVFMFCWSMFYDVCLKAMSIVDLSYLMCWCLLMSAAGLYNDCVRWNWKASSWGNNESFSFIWISCFPSYYWYTIYHIHPVSPSLSFSLCVCLSASLPPFLSLSLCLPFFLYIVSLLGSKHLDYLLTWL